MKRLLPGTSSDDTPRLPIVTGFVAPRVMTIQRPPTGAPVCLYAKCVADDLVSCLEAAILEVDRAVY